MSFGQRLLPGLVDDFRLAFPLIALRIHLTDRLVDIVEAGADLAIRISAAPTDKSTIWRKICEVPRMAVAAPHLFERYPRPRTPDDLALCPCLSYSADKTPELWRLDHGAAKRTHVAGQDIASNNGDFLYELVRAGAGLAVLPEFIVRDGLRDGTVEQILPDWQVAPLWLSLYYPPYETLPPLVATFTDFFETYLTDRTGFDFAPKP